MSLNLDRSTVIISHRRSGTHLTIDLVRNNFYNGGDYINLDKFIDFDKKQFDRIGFETALSDSPKVVKTHLLPNFDLYLDDQEDIEFITNFLNDNNLIYIKRDGRDVMVSLFHYVRNFNKSVLDDFSTFIKMNNEFDGTEKEYSRPAFWSYHVDSWANSNYDMQHLTYEMVLDDYKGVLDKVGNRLGVKLVMNKVVDVRMNSSSKANTLLKKVMIKLGLSKKSAVGFRKGVAGDYKNYFSDDDLNYFNSQINS